MLDLEKVDHDFDNLKDQEAIDLKEKIDLAHEHMLEFAGVDDEGEPQWLGTRENMIAFEEALELIN